MNSRTLSFRAIFVLAAFFAFKSHAQTTTTTFSTPGATTFTVPAGITSVTVQCWGGGGGGGNSNLLTGNGGGGGGGGAFSQKVFTGLTPGAVINLFVGSGGSGAVANSILAANDGQDSWFSTSTTVMAKGGVHGLNAGNGGAGGAAASGFGDVGFLFSGAVGTNSAANGGGGGGSSAGTGADGVAGVGATAGGIAPTGGGNGGAGSTGADGANASVPGGGGGGGNDAAANKGGNGGNGQVVVTYTLPNVTGLTASSSSVCIGSGSVVTVSSSNLASGTYTVTYTVSGTNTVGSSTASLIFTAGAPGTGTFSTSSLGVAGAANVVNITQLTASNNNFSTLAVSTAAFTTYGGSPAAPGSITGTSAQCASSGGFTYSISAVANATTYTWSVPTGWSITAGQGTTSITVSSGTFGQNGNITVTAGNPCGSSAATSFAVTTVACPITYYSRATGNWNASGSWSTVSHASATNTGTFPVAGDIVIIGGSHTITVPAGISSAAATVTVSDDATTCSLATNSTGSLTISGNLTVNSGGSLASSGTVVFNGSSNQTISGAGSFSFANLTLSTSSSVNVLVNSSISVSGAISWTADGLLVAGSSADITLGTAATITSPSSARYIQLDGSSSTNSNLIRTTTNAITQWQFTFPVGTATGGYTPVTIPTVTTAPANNSTLAVKPIVTGDLTGRLKRTFRMTITGNANATTFSNAVFNYSDVTDISSGDVETLYTTGWLLVSGGSWGIDAAAVNTAANTFTITGGSAATASLATGTYYYTAGSTISAQHTWYSYQTGNFTDFNTWTLDPSGTTFDNGLNVYPAFGDEIHILNGFTVTMDISAQTLSATTIEGGGILDLVSTTGHNFGVITGTGLLRTKGVALPIGTYTDFVAAITGGTIEYYDVSGNLSTTQTTYNILKMTNSTSSNIIFTLISNLTVNGAFTLSTTGSGTVTWQINDASNNQRTIVLNGDLTIGSGGRITVGTGNEGALASGTAGTPEHLLSMYGNFTNNGIVQFYDATDSELPVANYGLTTAATNNIYTNELQGNAVTVTFAGTTDNTITCNNTTDFYRLELNKGTGTQAVLTINSSSTSNFRLFGPTNQGSAGFGTAPNEYSANALSIINGTLNLTGSINIPNLDLSTGNDYFSIPQNGSLWLNSATVTVTVSNYDPANNFLTKRLMVNGLLRITSGTLDAGISAGIGAQDGGTYLQEGGTVKCWQFRPRASGSGIFAFIMTGGTLNVGYGYSVGQGYDNNAYARFDLNLSGSTFQMTGGTMNLAKPVQNSGIFNVVSSAGNYSVTGGTINMYSGFVSGTTEYIGYINSTAPLYDVNIFRESGSTTNAQLQNLDLIVLNNLTIDNSSATQTPSFLLSSGTDRNLTVGGSFNIQANTTFTPGTTSTVTFNGAGAQTWTHNGTITRLVNVVVSKTAGTLTLAGANTFPNISGAVTGLTITSGTLADGGKTITVDGAISNSGIHSGAGKIIVTTATTIGGSNGTFGNLRITTNGTVATSGKQTVSGNLELNGSASCILNIASNNLTVLGTLTTTGTFGINYYIKTSGIYNAGGLTRQGASGDILFPVGATLYTPNTINATATTYGTVTVRPVASEHPNVTVTAQSLQYFWRVTSSGYAGISAVTHKTYSFSTATKSGTLTSYHSARYDASANGWATNNTIFDATAVTVIPNFSTGTGWAGVVGDQLDGEYTCGNTTAFGGVTVYYSRQSGAWNLTSTWSNVGVGNATQASTAPPCATCPVIIGDGASNNHTITIDANSRTCGTLNINSGSTLDCSTFTSLNFGTNTGGFVSGNGTLRIASANFPGGDFTNFIGSSGGTVEWYGTTKTIPSAGPAPQNLSLVTYYNLVLNPTAANTITLPANNLTIYNNWTQGSSAAGTVTNNGARTLAITGGLTITSGTFSLAAGNTTITVGGSVSNSGTFNTTAGTHTLAVTGGITNNNVINFNNTGTVALTFTGSSNVSFNGSGAGGTTLSTVTVNKGSSQTPTVTFSVGGTVTTTATATGWLTLTNGTFDFANTGTVTTSISTTSYTIPSTGKLKVSGSLVTVNTTSGDADANDLFLNGALEVAGGTVNVGNTTVNTNSVDIEYAAAGTPTINVSSGNLWVKASVRRSTTTLTGALVYNQTGGTVTIGGISAADNNSRGVFEIDNNTGSSFTLTGATTSLIVQRQSGGTGYADLFLDPATSNVSSTSTITVGLTATATVQNNLRINIAPTIGSFTVGNGTGTSAQTVKMFSNPLVVGGTLTIPTPSILVTNNLNVTVAGDFASAGTYTSGTNNTTFNGTGAQLASLSANTDFYDFTVSKTAGTRLTLSGTAPATSKAINNLNILTGILDVGSLDLPVGRNITINSSQEGTGSILYYSTGVSNTITSSGGSFTNLKLDGTATNRTINVSGDLTINGALTFNVPVRYLMIGSNQLTFGTSGTIVGASSANGFIRTNGVSSDLGVLKNWPTGTNTFVYEVGTTTNYTPVSLSLNVTTAGTMSVFPVNSAPLTYNQASSEQILNYFWTVTHGNTLVATKTANHTFQYPSTFITGTGGSLVAGYLDDSNPVGWITSGHGGTATTTQMDFTPAPSTNLPSAGISYDYTVGTPNTLPNPIVPLYSRLGLASVANQNLGGNWTTASNWTTDTDGDLDLNNPSSFVPGGVPVVILPGARINTTSNGRKAFKTTLNGLLDNNTRTGHNLGVISGTGTYRTATTTFPAGNYTAFVAAGGGTIEYAGAITMNSRSTYNNLKISSTVTTSATDLILNGNLIIGSGNSLDNTVNNADISLAGDWLNSGTFSAGTGLVTFAGTTAAQSITITGTNTFNNLTFNNTFSTAPQITLSGGDIVVGSALTMTSGSVNLNSQNFTIGTAASTPGTLSHSLSSSSGWMYGGNLTRYFNTTAIADGSVTGFFPIGTSVDFRPFFISVPAGDMTTGGTFTVSDGSATTSVLVTIPDTNPVATVLGQYQGAWSISSAGISGGTYDLIAGGTGFGVIGNLADLRLTKATSAVGTHVAATNTTSDPRLYRTGLLLSDLTTTDGNQFFVGSTNIVTSPLPIELVSFTGESTDRGVDLRWTTSSETNNEYFTVLHSYDGEQFDELGRVKGSGTSNVSHNYSLTDTKPMVGLNYYRLKQTDFDGKTSTFKTIAVKVDRGISVYPNPVNRQETLYMEMAGLKPNQAVGFQLVNMQGIVLHQSSLQATGEGTVSVSYSPTDIAPGLYIVNLGTARVKVVIL